MAGGLNNPPPPGAPFTGGLPNTVGAPVDNQGLTTAALQLMIQAWNTNTAALGALLTHVGGTITGDVSGGLPGPVEVIATHLGSPLPINQGGTGNSLGEATPTGAAGGDLGGTFPDPVVNATHLLAPLPVAQGGLGIGSGTSGGILAFTASGVVGSSGLLTEHALVVGGGAGVAPSTLGSLGTTTTVLHGNAAGLPVFGPVVLTTDVSGILPQANGGTGNITGQPSGAAGGDLSGTFPNPAVSQIAGAAVAPGVWTPTDASGATLVFTGVSAGYTRIGNMVFAYAKLVYPSQSNGNNATVGGLPFNAANQGYADVPAAVFVIGGTVALVIAPVANTNTAVLLNQATGAQVTNASLSTLPVRFLLVYPVA